MKKISKYICFSAIYFILVIASIFLMDFLFCISSETAVKTGEASALLYLGFMLLLAFKNRYFQKDKEIAEKKYIHTMQNKKHAATIVMCSLLCILFWSGSYIFYENERGETPWSLTEFGIKYPEAHEFVSGYHKYKNTPFDTDLRLDVVKGEIPLFIQWDKRWGYQYYGNDLLGITGCGPTCISMVVCGLTGSDDWNPYRVSQFSEENGYYVPGEGTSWNLMTYGAEKLGLDSEMGTISADYIMNNLSVSTPMICSMNPGDFTYTGHFIVLTGIDSNGDIIVNDPNSKKNSQKRWSLETLIPQIRSIWKYVVNTK
ncbi:MAG: papain-like cysteine protease family protein [Eubacteriales bacterium]|nr:papain-like cysteine protease family protein [Eubacteriales bacterium]